MFLIVWKSDDTDLSSLLDKPMSEIESLSIDNTKVVSKTELITELSHLLQNGFSFEDIAIFSKTRGILISDLLDEEIVPIPNSIVRITTDPDKRFSLAMGIVLPTYLDDPIPKELLPCENFLRSCQIEEDDITFVLKTLGDQPRAKVFSLFDRTHIIDEVCLGAYHYSITEDTKRLSYFGLLAVNIAGQKSHYINPLVARQLFAIDENGNSLPEYAFAAYDIDGNITHFITYYFPERIYSIPYEQTIKDSKEIVLTEESTSIFPVLVKLLTPRELKKYFSLLVDQNFICFFCTLIPYWVTLINLEGLGLPYFRKVFLKIVKTYKKEQSKKYSEFQVEIDDKIARQEHLPKEFRAIANTVDKSRFSLHILTKLLSYYESLIFLRNN